MVIYNAILEDSHHSMLLWDKDLQLYQLCNICSRDISQGLPVTYQAPCGLHIQHEWQDLLTLLKYIYLKVIQPLNVQVNFNLDKKMESLQ